MRLVALALSYNGLLALCLAMPKHARPLMPTDGPLRTGLWRIVGWSLLALSLALSIHANGWSFGPIEWIGFLAVTGLLLVGVRPYAPSIATMLGWVGLLMAVPSCMLQSP